MANRIATISVDLSYQGAATFTVAAPRMIVHPGYLAYNTGIVDIPAGSVTGAEFPVPFGSSTTASAVIIRNVSAETLRLATNGATGAGIDLPDGGLFVFAATGPAPVASLASVSLSALRVCVTAGSFEYWVFGDPTA